MPRPYWSGTLQISLVSFGVKFFVATEAKSQIRFHQISRSSGERVRHQKVLESSLEPQDDADSGETPSAPAAVVKDDIVKGYEYAKGQYVQIEPGEIANLRVPSKHTIAIEQFVSEDEIDPAYFDKPYFVAPDGDTQVEAFAVVRQAMQQAGKVAIGKVAFAGREHVVAFMANKDDKLPGLMAYTMRYQEELRQPAEYFGSIPAVAIEEDQLDLAEQLIKKRTTKFDPSRYKDGYEVALKELVNAKVNNLPIPREEEAAPRKAKVVNLMDALRSSLQATGAAGKNDTEEAAPAKKPAARSEKSDHAKEKPGPTLVKAPKKAPAAAKPATPKTAGPRRKSA